VVGVVVGDEGVAERGQREFRLDQLEGHAVAGVDHVGDVVPDDEVGGRAGLVVGDARSAARPEKHEPVAAEIASLRRGLPPSAERDRKRGRRARAEQVPAGDHQALSFVLADAVWQLRARPRIRRLNFFSTDIDPVLNQLRPPCD
jgi:hypothetical protein